MEKLGFGLAMRDAGDADTLKRFLQEEFQGCWVQLLDQGESQALQVVIANHNLVGDAEQSFGLMPQRPLLVALLPLNALDELDALHQAGAECVLQTPQYLQRLGQVIRKHLEAQDIQSQLRYANAQLGQMQRVARMGTWSFEVASQHYQWSPHLYRLLGLDERKAPSEALFLSVVYPEDRSQVQEAWQARLEGQAYVLNYRIEAAGRLRWLHDEAQVEVDHWGNVVRCSGVIQDVTERRRADEALWRREILLRQAQRIGQMGSWQYDLIHKRLYWSEQTFSILGMLPDVMLNDQAMWAAVHPDDLDRVQEAWYRALRGEETYSIDYRVIVGDEVRWVHSRAEIQFDGHSQAIEAIGTLKDITERRLSRD